jgi:hypothetical protein
VFVGDLPYVVYEMMQSFSNEESWYESFPCDLFFMDLDGTWSDIRSEGSVQPGNGLLDTRSGNLDLEIWVSRMRADNLPQCGIESDLLSRCFRKNHDYRRRRAVPQKRALAYIDDDWADWGCEDAQFAGYVYGDKSCGVIGFENTTESDYKQNQLPDKCELILVRSHGYTGGHGFYENGGVDFNYVFSSDYREIGPPAAFYSFFVCSGCDFTVEDNLAGTAIFNTNGSALAAWGSTKTGGVWAERSLYEQFASGATIGEAFKEWFNEGQSYYPEYAPQWWYGMVLVGDGALRLNSSEPAAAGQPVVTGESSVTWNVVKGRSYVMQKASSLNGNWENSGSEFSALDYSIATDIGLGEESAVFRRLVETGPDMNLLLNGSFEGPADSEHSCRGWAWEWPDQHGSTWGSAARERWGAFDGQWVAAIRRDDLDYGGWWREAVAVPGQAYEASAWFRVDDDSWAASPQELKLEFWSSASSLLLTAATNLSAVGETWSREAVVATAPAGAAWVRFVVSVSGAGTSGALQFDEARLVGK